VKLRVLFALGFALVACGRPLPLTVTPVFIALVDAPPWKTLAAQHRVTVDVTLDGDKHDKRTLRGIIAVGRPDRFRLRALGPAGITLFDLLVRNGEAKIVSAIRSPSDGAAGQALAGVITSLAADLACAYTLEPRPADRHVRKEGNTILVEEPGRVVMLSHFAGTPPVWRHAEITSGRYHVIVEVDAAEVDAVLDPSLFAD